MAMRWTACLGRALVLLALAGCAAPSASSPPASGAAGAPVASAPAAPTSAPAAAAPASTAAPALVPLRLGLNSPSANIAPVWVAKDEGFFAKYGIDAELLPIPGGERIVTALIAGEIPLSLLSGTGLVTANLGGAELAFFGSFGNRLRYWLYVRPEIGSVPELRGKQVAITGRGGINRRSLELALERNGLDPDRDVTMISVGQSTDALVALLSGVVAGTMLSPPAIFRAEDEGMRMLVNTNEYNYPAVIAGIAGTRAWVGQNEDVTRRTMQALAEAINFSLREKDRTKEIIARHTQTDDAVLLERSYGASSAGWERNLRVPPEAIQSELETLVAELPAARAARPEQFLDNRLVDPLEQGGFFRQIGW
jgi:NitT/TauT family transport system substrate-binding protein